MRKKKLLGKSKIQRFKEWIVSIFKTPKTQSLTGLSVLVVKKITDEDIANIYNKVKSGNGTRTGAWKDFIIEEKHPPIAVTLNEYNHMQSPDYGVIDLKNTKERKYIHETSIHRSL